MVGSEGVLLSARVGEFDAHTTWGRVAATRRLLLAGDHVVWHDGHDVHEWRLPDQPADASVPTLARVVFARSAAVMVDGGLEIPEVHVLLVADDGRTLAPVAVAGAAYAGMSEAELEKVWPRASFEALGAWGVTVDDVETRDVGELRQRFPGAIPASRVLMYSRRTFVIYAALLALAIVAAFLLTRG